MLSRYHALATASCQPWALFLAGCAWLLSATAAAQAPTITSLSPGPNARLAPRSGPVTVTFSQPLTAGSAAALRVYSAQRGGLRSGGTTPVVVTGNQLSFSPTNYDFRPGETIFSTVTQAATSSGGTLATPRVQQFTAAVGGTGRGTFSSVRIAASGGNPENVALGDVDGDGYLDAVSTEYTTYIRVRLGSSTGGLSGSRIYTVGQNPRGIVLADVNGDGLLDALVSNYGDATVSVCFGDGQGQFGVKQTLATGTQPNGLAVGDLDGDGDLDVVVAATGSNRVDRFLNSGTGTFGLAQAIPAGTNPVAVSVGDLDNDGDLDLVAANNGEATVSVYVNSGNAGFTTVQSLPTDAGPIALTLGDLDGDGDLDLATSCATEGTVRLALNSGGRFTAGQRLSLGASLYGLALGDLDADGDLDLAVSQANSGAVYTALNAGTGVFGSVTKVPVGVSPHGLALADMDKDNDLDLVAADYGYSLALQLNGGTGILATLPGALTPAVSVQPNPARGLVRLNVPATVSTVQLLDPLGRVMRTLATPLGGDLRLDVSNLSPGIYFVRAGDATTRFMVE